MAQKSLFVIPMKNDKNKDSEAIEKVKSKISTGNVVTVRGGGNSAMGKITAISELVKRMLGNDEGKLAKLTDIHEFKRYMKQARKNGVLALDTETDGLDYIEKQIAGICIYTPGELPAYVPINHVNYITGMRIKDQMPRDIVVEELSNLAEVKLIFHNAKFDMGVIKWQLGVTVNPYWCTQIGACMLNENEPHNLKYLHEKYVAKTGKDQKELATYSTLFEGMPFTQVPLDVGYLYAAKDPLMTYEVYKFQEKFLDEESPNCRSKKLQKVAWVFRHIEMPLIEVVLDMESTGVNIDVPYAKELSVKYRKEYDKAVVALKKEYDRLSDELAQFKKKNPGAYASLENPINPNSPKQLAILFYDVLGLESPDSEKPRGTGEEILEEFDLPIAKAVLDCRSLNKLLGTYIEKLPKLVKKKTGKLHGSFKQYGAKTGRFSSEDPNLQNIPSQNKDIRKMFIAQDGWLLIGGDYSQQEPRCLAHKSQDEHLIEAYNKGLDVYAVIASKVFKVAYEECMEFFPDGTKNPEGKKRRDAIKGIVLGIMYGRGAGSIASKLGISKKEAQKIIDEFFVMFPKVANFIQEVQQGARDYGFVDTIYGRKRRLPDMQLEPYEFSLAKGGEVDDYTVKTYTTMLNNAFGKKKNDIVKKAKVDGIIIKNNGGKIAQAERQCVNSIIQGSSADMTKLALIALYNNKELRKLQYKILLTVHDEIIGTCPQENAKRVKELVKETMISCANLSVPMKCDIEVTKKWYGEEIEVA